MASSRRWWSVGAAATLLGATLTASAETPAPDACDGPVVHATAELESAWGTSLDLLRKQLASRHDVDRCAEVDLVSESTHVLVMIRLADGRVAARRVDTPIAAMASVEALLTVLPDMKVEQAPTDAAPVQKAPVVVASAKPAAREVTARASPGPQARVVEIDVGIGASVHVAGHPWFLGYGLAGHVSVAINNWLLGSWLRWDIQDHLLEGTAPRGLVVSSFLLGAFTGRRFALGKAALDLVVGPNLVVDTEEAAGTEGIDVGGELGTVTLSGGLRVLVPRHGAPGFFGMCVGELNPNRVNHRIRADPSLPALPPWGASLVLGVVWGGL